METLGDPHDEYANWKAPETDVPSDRATEAITDPIANLTKEQISALNEVGALNWRAIRTDEQGTMGPLKDLIDGNFEDDATMAWRQEQAREILGITDQNDNNESKKVEPEQVATTQGSVNQNENEVNAEKESEFRDQIIDYLKIVANDEGIKGTIDNYIANGNNENRLKVLSKMPQPMYNLIHNSGMSYQEVINGINVNDKETFVRNFNSEISDKLIDIVNNGSKVRHITDQELIQGGQPEQTAFVWFKGNAPRPANARELRFYINASPDGTPQVADYLGKLSDQLDQYGMRVQFKFRKDLGEYDRTDTCVAYLYMPESKTPEQKAISDQWVETVKSSLIQIPKESLKKGNSFFTEKIADGLSYTEDTRDSMSKKGESYTSQITKSISEVCADVADRYETLTPEAIDEISNHTIEKLKALNYKF